MNDIGFYFGIFFYNGYVLVKLLKEVYLSWIQALGASVYGSRGPINNKILNLAILDKEGLKLTLPPQRALLMHRGLLLVGFWHVTLHGLIVPSEVSRASKALEAVKES
jgi:hypothetical protein